MRISVITDGSEGCLRGVHKAVDLAQKEPVEVTVVAIAIYPKTAAGALPPSEKNELDKRAADALEEAKNLFKTKGLEVEGVIETGRNPCEGVIKRAEQGKIDLLVMGCKGLGIKQAVVACNVACNVLLVR